MGMKQRCYNENNQHYKTYGARGITICDEWISPDGACSFYEWSLDHGYSDDLTIDRVDNSKGYSPSNCIWVPNHINHPFDDLTVKLFYIIHRVPTFECEYLLPMINSIENERDRKYLLEQYKDANKQCRRRKLSDHK